MGSLIQCKDLWKVYRLGDVSVPALRGVSVEVQHRELLAVMGASGSGKTTLMNVLGCLDRPTQGTYCLDGRDVGQALPNDLAEIRNLKIGFVFQNFSLIPRTSALENVQLPLLYRGVSLRQQREEAAAALARVGLDDRQRHFPSQLSGGQQQRVAIARALVARPAILLADEPTGNLDTESSQDIMSILTDLNRTDGLTVILVTHEPDIAAYAGRQIVMKDGHIVSDRQTAIPPRLSRGIDP
jgi:putative ABC transport system ATP-binding protein